MNSKIKLLICFFKTVIEFFILGFLSAEIFMNWAQLLGLSNFFEKNAASKYKYASEQWVGVAQIYKMI